MTALRKGWTTGACATAAAAAAFEALLTGRFPDPVRIALPRGLMPAFALAEQARTGDAASAAVVKDAGDDPDVTHGVLVRAAVRLGPPGAGVTFHAGPGVGVVTRPGLPLPPGEPAINPAPRRMIVDNLAAVAQRHGAPLDVAVTVSIPGGEVLARQTWNPRLGIVNGLSVLGTTGVVIPFSCSAWIHAIHRGVDVARAAGLPHLVGATGRTSEAAARQLFGLPEEAMLDMGDFAGGLLKYVRAHPAPRLTIAGGFGKLVKLAQGHGDLHSSRSQADYGRLADLAAHAGASPAQAAAIRTVRTAYEALTVWEGLPQAVAQQARTAARSMLEDGRGRGKATALDVLAVGRDGRVLAHAC